MKRFPTGALVAQVRIARPTGRLDQVTAFYRDGLGLTVIGQFKDHAGYSGVMLGLPDAAFHLEFTQAASGSPGRSPSGDDLLVLYVTDEADRKQLYTRLERFGAKEVVPENPYWHDKSRCFADPDGWTVVICAETGI